MAKKWFDLIILENEVNPGEELFNKLARFANLAGLGPGDLIVCKIYEHPGPPKQPTELSCIYYAEKEIEFEQVPDDLQSWVIQKPGDVTDHKDLISEMQQAAKLIELDGLDAFQTVAAKYGKSIAVALLVAHMRRSHGSMDVSEPHPNLDEEVLQAVLEIVQ
jgi:hypothetical protein